MQDNQTLKEPNMPNFDDRRQEVIAKIIQSIQEKLPKAKAKLLQVFAQKFFAGVSWHDMKDRSVSDLYGLLLSHWHQFECRKPGEVKVETYNPNYEQHGWQTTHTAVAITIDDMPFLVDSILMALHHFNYTPHFIIHFSAHAIRDDAGKVAKVFNSNRTTSDAIIYVEIDRQSDPKMLGELKQHIIQVMDDVTVAVEDWQPMICQVKDTIQQLKPSNVKNAVSADELKETKEFLTWLSENHFTFLGYQDFVVDKKGIKPVEGTGLGILREDRKSLERDAASFNIAQQDLQSACNECLLNISKSSARSTIHRPVHLDLISTKLYKNGKVVGERRFWGLYTSVAYSSRPQNIPLIRRKVKQIMDGSKLTASGHGGKELLNILETYPRDELFQATADELFVITRGILQLQERKQVRLFIRKEAFGRTISCLVFVPRDRFDTNLRKKLQNIIQTELSAYEVEFSTHMSESVLVRVLFTAHVNPDDTFEVDTTRIEQKLLDATKIWEDELKNALTDQMGEEKASYLFHKFENAFPIHYRDSHLPQSAVFDINHIEELPNRKGLGMSLYRPLEAAESVYGFKLFHIGNEPIPLSDILPLLENMGLRVLGEHPFKVKMEDKICWIQDFSIQYQHKHSFSLNAVKEKFEDAYGHIWFGHAENDGFNKLVLSAGLTWRETAIFRAYAKYLQQIRFTFSQTYIEETLNNNPGIVKLLIQLFHSTFCPEPEKSRERSRQENIPSLIYQELDSVSNLDEDRIIRRYLTMIQATLRTNFFQTDNGGQPKTYISFKLDPTKIPDMPLPRPAYEIFVFSPKVEGVHLRGGKVARGGIRWSDRKEDFRTEILGLTKAQQVKNAVIVPVGAKGGFIAKQITPDMSREDKAKTGIEAYSTFIRGLLDISDNLKFGKVLPPKDTIRLDGDDPYLVVAADKGTATFSDIANSIAKEYDFWLDDAFASGGSIGYDHKKMGITAKGAWESVKRHFREQDLNTQEECFTVVGIGDMAGDVFGNGMLLSEHIQLIGAFNHMHIFIDPKPDAKTSFKERERLFVKPRSSWADYNAKLISKGGGVFERSAKSIPLTSEIKELFNIKQDTIEPNELIKAMLKAKVDLLWNGGIGTYVKANSESHDDVGDRANNPVRINGKELRAKVVGEGGNLGLTQLGRIEYALNGGRIYTDFIDNAAGVNCSDNEVNIKILLNEIVSNGDMTEKQRQKLLADMTNDVSDIVLFSNYKQSQALSIAKKRASARLEDHIRLIHELESLDKLDRELEGIPCDEELTERKLDNKALTTPEIAVLLAYTKNILQEDILASDLPENDFFLEALQCAFPKRLRKPFIATIKTHRLRREIIATQVANIMINEMGASFVQRLKDETGSNVESIAVCYFTARAIFNMQGLLSEIEALDNKIAVDTQIDMMLDVMRLIRRQTRWFLKNYRSGIDIKKTIKHYKPHAELLSENLYKFLPAEDSKSIQTRVSELKKLKVPVSLAQSIANLKALYPALDIIKASVTSDNTIKTITQLHFELGKQLNLKWLRDRIAAHKSESHWESVAISAFRDDLDQHQSLLTVEITKQKSDSKQLTHQIQQWMKQHKSQVAQWQKLVSDSSSSGSTEFALFPVAIRELSDLVQLNKHNDI